LSFLNPPQGFARAYNFNSGIPARFAKVTLVKFDDRVGLPLHRRLQYQFVAGIVELGSIAAVIPDG
jgi:hypothetical protein